MCSTCVKTCVVGYSIHVFPCFFFTPTSIDYREPNVLATMQQPSSVVHSKLQCAQQYTKKQKKAGVRAVQNFGGKLLHTCTSSVRGNACNQPVIRMGEVSTHPIQRVGLTPDVPGNASSAHVGCSCGLESITEASSQAVVWPLLMHGMFSNSRG